MINTEISENIKNKFIKKLNHYIRRDEREKSLIMSAMILVFIVSLIFTEISTIMIINSYRVSNSVVEGANSYE